MGRRPGVSLHRRGQRRRQDLEADRGHEPQHQGIQPRRLQARFRPDEHPLPAVPHDGQYHEQSRSPGRGAGIQHHRRGEVGAIRIDRSRNSFILPTMNTLVPGRDSNGHEICPAKSLPQHKRIVPMSIPAKSTVGLLLGGGWIAPSCSERSWNATAGFNRSMLVGASWGRSRSSRRYGDFRRRWRRLDWRKSSCWTFRFTPPGWRRPPGRVINRRPPRMFNARRLHG